MIINQADRLNLVEEYYFSRKLQQIADMQKAGKPVINLGIGSPDLKPSQETIDALNFHANRDNIHGYQSYRCIPELREAISNWYSKVFNVKPNPATEILPLIGSKEGIMHIGMSFLNPGDAVLTPNPGYPTYTSVSKLTGAEVINYDLAEEKNWEVDLEKLEKQDLSKVKIMWLNYPNMPTGAVASDELFKKLIAFAHKHKILLCHDNPYSLILNNKHKSILSYEGAWEVALELNSFSKSHNMAGWRLGYIIGKKEYIDTILKFKSNMDSGIFYGLQQAAIKALDNPIKWHENQNIIYKKRREYAYKIMDLLQCAYNKDQVGMFVWAKVPKEVKNTEEFLEDILQNALVFLTPGFIFGSNGERFVRISLCTKEEIMEESYKRIKKFIDEK